MERTSRLFPVIASVIVILLSGCAAQREVYFPKPAVPVKLGQPLKGVKVFVPVKDGYIEATADLFPGQIIMTDPEEFNPSAIRELQNILLLESKENVNGTKP